MLVGMPLSPYVQNISMSKPLPKRNKPDYKKTFFEDCLNNKGVPISGMARLIQKYGYFYDYENGRYYVYDSYEWDLRKQFNKEIKPIFDAMLKNLL